jgi:hypothetical protein
MIQRAKPRIKQSKQLTLLCVFANIQVHFQRVEHLSFAHHIVCQPRTTTNRRSMIGTGGLRAVVKYQSDRQWDSNCRPRQLAMQIWLVHES